MKFACCAVFLCALCGCLSTRSISPMTGEKGFPEVHSSIPNPEEFSAADLNKDSLIDLNESAEFFDSHQKVDYIAPLWAIAVIISLVVVACSFSTVRFFFKSLWGKAKESWARIYKWLKSKFKK